MGLTSGVLLVAVAGQTVGALRKISVLAPRRPDAGPQGYPVNRTAAQAGIGGGATDDDRFVLSVEGDVGRPLTLGLTELRAMPQRTVRLPISCVEGWSFSARWTGVPLRDLLARAGAPDGTGATVESMEAEGAYRTSPLNRLQARDPDTLLPSSSTASRWPSTTAIRCASSLPTDRACNRPSGSAGSCHLHEHGSAIRPRHRGGLPEGALSVVLAGAPGRGHVHGRGRAGPDRQPGGGHGHQPSRMVAGVAGRQRVP